jgi:hypothetical protein
MILIPNGARVGAEGELYRVEHAARPVPASLREGLVLRSLAEALAGNGWNGTRYVMRPDHCRFSPMRNTSAQAPFGINPAFSRPFSASF